MSRFAKLALATAVATLLMVGLGGLVRATGAGLGCGPEWPRCHGRLVPPSTVPSWTEHSHRLWALVVIALIIALAVNARRTTVSSGMRRAAYLLVPLVLSQALLGAVVVWLRLQPISVAAHLAVALSILGVASGLFVAATSSPVDNGAPGRTSTLAVAAAGVTFAQLVLGSLVTGAGAGLAYRSFPDFDGALLPAAGSVGEGLHVAHRFGAVVVATMVVALAVRLRPGSGRGFARPASQVAVALVVVQIGLGAVTVLSRLSAPVVVAHLVVGALLWICLVTVVVDTAAGQRKPAAAPGLRREPATVR